MIILKLTRLLHRIHADLCDALRKNRKVILIHLIVWILILTINFIFLKNYIFNFDLKFHALIWIVYISLFYITYALFIPLFLFRNRIFVFIAGSLILLSAAYFINNSIARNQFITVFRMEGTDSRNSFGQGEFKPVPPNLKMPPEFDRKELRRPEFERMLQKKQPHERRPDFGRKLFPLYGLLLVYFTGITAKILVRFKDDEKKKEEIMKERVSTELQYLKQQINPHFLFNTLNNIYSLSIKQPELTPDAILKVSSILRYTLYKNDNSLTFLKDEIEIINAYIDFQKMRFRNNIPITYNVTGSLEGYKIEPFILLPLVENAFKYGMANIKNSFIDIQLEIIEEKLRFVIRNKKSYINEKDPEHSGLGLKNIKRRLDLICADCHEFRIEDKNDIFTVFLELPLRME